MNILLITYYFGETASGLISKRVAEALALKGLDIEVVTSSKIEDGYNDKIHVHSIISPIKKGCVLGRILAKLRESRLVLINHYFWEIRSKWYASKLVSNKHIDIVYSRSSPIDACIVGDYIKKKYGIPIVQHFSDPIPAPYEYLPSSNRRRLLTKLVRDILTSCDLASYGNLDMLNYIMKQCDLDINNKVFISPDMASGDSIIYIERKKRDLLIFTYLGNIYGGRNPYVLFDALNELIKTGLSLELRIYSQLDTVDIVKYPFVKCYPKTNDIISALADSDILVDLDGDDLIPVFISSKLKDYLLINRPILSITPNNSPSSRLLKGLETVCVSNNNLNSILTGVKQLLLDIPEEKYNERALLVNQFSPNNVANTIIDNFKRLKPEIS